MIRIYLAPQIGTGTRQDPFRSLLHDLINVAGGDSFDEIDNPAKRMTVCTVTASQVTHDAIAADGRVTPLMPAVVSDMDALNAVLDTQFSSFDSTWRSATSAAAELAGINTGWINLTNTLRDVMQYLLRVHVFAQLIDGSAYPNIKTLIAANLGTPMSSIPAGVKTAASSWLSARGLSAGWVTPTTTVRQVVHYVVTNLGFGAINFAKTGF